LTNVTSQNCKDAVRAIYGIGTGAHQAHVKVLCRIRRCHSQDVTTSYKLKHGKTRPIRVQLPQKKNGLVARVHDHDDDNDGDGRRYATEE